MARGLYGAERYEEANRVFRARLGMYRRRVLGNVSQRGYELETCQQQLQILNNIAFVPVWKSDFGRPTPSTRYNLTHWLMSTQVLLQPAQTL